MSDPILQYLDSLRDQLIEDLQDADSRREELRLRLEIVNELRTRLDWGWGQSTGGAIGRALDLIGSNAQGLTTGEVIEQMNAEGRFFKPNSLRAQLSERQRRGLIWRDPSGRYRKVSDCTFVVPMPAEAAA